MRPLTVLQLAANRWWTGSAEPVVHLALALEARGHRVILGVTPGDRFASKALAAGLELLPGLALGSGGRLSGAARDIVRVRRALDLRRVDVIHANHSHDHWIAVAASHLPGRRRVPVARTFHHRRAVRSDALARWLYRRTALACAASAGVARRCGEVLSGVPTIEIPGTTDLVRFRPGRDGAGIRAEFDLAGTRVAVSVARLAPGRGHAELLAGFRSLVDTLPDARLLLVGKGEARAEIEHAIGHHGLERHVLMAGYRDADLPEVLAVADCFVLMASGSEESCRAALEAMACGLPIVAARAGALPETVEDGITGFLLPDRRPETIAERLGRVLGDRELAARMGSAGRRRVEREFTRERLGRIVEAAYAAVT